MYTCIIYAMYQHIYAWLPNKQKLIFNPRERERGRTGGWERKTERRERREREREAENRERGYECG